MNWSTTYSVHRRVVISNVSIDSKVPFYSPTVRRASHLENGVIYFVQTDMTYKYYKDIEPDITKARNEFGADKFIEGKDIGEHNKAIDIAKEMLNKNMDINLISELTKLSKKEINKVKKEMK